jgi:hypothetical protein
VRIHDIALAVDAGDPAAALRVAARWAPPADLPAERRSHFYIEIARAAVQVPAAGRAFDALVTARRIAPQHVRDHPHVHEVLDLLASGTAGLGSDLEDYLGWAGHTGGLS